MKKPIFKYGVEIKKPWTGEMYEHNENVAEEAKANIKKAIETAYSAIWTDPSDEEYFDEDLRDYFRGLSKNITAYSFGGGFEEADVLEKTLEELDTAPTYWLKEAYEYFEYDGVVEKLEPGFIGYETKEELKFLSDHQDAANMVAFTK